MLPPKQNYCHPSYKVRFLALGSIIVGISLLGVICELGIRWLRPDLVPSLQIRTIPDPFIGWRSLPCQEFQGKTENGNRRRIRSNALGFFDTNHDVQAQAETLRIAFLGDSFTAAAHVDFEDSFVSTVQKGLQKSCPKTRFEVLNFGQPSFGTVNEYLCWKHYASQFHPNIVILAFFLGNDVTNNLPDYQYEIFQSPKFIMNHGDLQPLPFQMGFNEKKNNNHNWFYRTFLEPSALYQQYKLFERNMRAKLHIKHSRKLQSKNAEIPFWKRDYAPVDWHVYLSKPDDEIELGWKITEALLLRLRDEVHASGARLHIVLLPGVESMLPEKFHESWTRYPGIEKYDFDLDYPRKRLLHFLTDHKIPVLDIASRFHEVLPGEQSAKLYFQFDQHFSVLGHHLAGGSITHYLEKEVVIFKH